MRHRQHGSEIAETGTGNEAVPDALVVVQGEWNGWTTSIVRCRDLKDLHRFRPIGAPRPLLHAYVRRKNLGSGDIRHDSQRTSLPDYVRVCILKCHNPQWIFEELSRSADLDSRALRNTPACTRPNVGSEDQNFRADRLLARVSLGASAILAAGATVQWYRRANRRN